MQILNGSMPSFVDKRVGNNNKIVMAQYNALAYILDTLLYTYIHSCKCLPDFTCEMQQLPAKEKKKIRLLYEFLSSRIGNDD